MAEENEKKKSKWEGLRKFGLGIAGMASGIIIGKLSGDWSKATHIVEVSIIISVTGNVVADHVIKFVGGIFGNKNNEEVKK